MTDKKIELKELTLDRLASDEKYKKVLSNVEDEETRKKIDSIVKEFIGELSEGLSKLDDPEIRKKLTEFIKHGR